MKTININPCNLGKHTVRPMDGIGKDRLRAAPNVFFFENHSSKVLKSRFLCHKLGEQTLAADEYF